MIDTTELENKLGYLFKDKSLLIHSLSHSSYTNKDRNSNGLLSNERLEFLGDKILGFVVADYVYEFFSNKTEGVLSMCIAYLNSSEILFKVSKFLNLEKFIYCYDLKKESLNKVYSNTVEAILAAIYLDSNKSIDEVKKIIINLWKVYINDNLIRDVKLQFNPKSMLQEWAQKNKLPLPEYRVIKKEGTEHAPLFYIEIKVKNFETIVVKANNKKIGEKQAAKKFIQMNNVI